MTEEKDCKSCDTCEHEYKHKRTPGEVWAKVKKPGCPVPSCLWPETHCNDCTAQLAQVYDKGHSAGYAKGTHDERGYAAQYESQQPKPKPAMTVEKWWDTRSNVCYIGTGWKQSPCFRKSFCGVCPAKRAAENYIKLNQGCIVTKEGS